MRSNKLAAIDETECLSPSQSPENSFLQPSPTKLTITKTYSNKGKFMLIVNGYNFQFKNFNRKKTIKFWRCTNRSCNVILHTNSDDTFTVTKIPVEQSQEDNLNYAERTILNYQKLVLDKLDKMDNRLSSIETALSSVEHGLGFLNERQSIPTIIKLLNEEYLIDIQHLDRRILSSDETYNMQLFFRFVSSNMTQDYNNRWNLIRNCIVTSFTPTKIN
ncbi:unnamed protein product [Rotaria magnacalcarata]|uniref:FLYWCH-type domain-containing protein n=2 Tax=Rotaria magnacalcarata TaxID=392030 RepID=A0A815T6B4_9BILA|nr:unnamed protein product [Rotaria magnacalcarata]CAF4414926.1 unnamed protein product [Rotaria magnacalcarata]